MRRSIVLLVLGGAAIALLLAQRERAPVHAPYEFKALLPREVLPAQYQQVEQRDLESVTDQGWELVSVMPFVYRNEERGHALNNKPAVTQTYPAYFFKRLKPENGRR